MTLAESMVHGYGDAHVFFDTTVDFVNELVSILHFCLILKLLKNHISDSDK